MVLVYIFDLFKDNLFAFLRGHIIARNYFLNHELFIIYEKKILFKKTFFLPHMHQRGQILLQSTIKRPMETSFRLWASLK